MVAAEPPHEHDRIEADQHDRCDRIATEHSRALPHQEDRAEAGRRQQRLHRPQRRRHAERHERECQNREQRPVRTEQLVPVAQRVARIVVRLEDRNRRVRVELVHDLHTPVVDVVEDVGERERRREQEGDVHRDDRHDRPARAEARHVAQRQRIADVHQHQRPGEQVLQRRRAARQRRQQPAQRAGHPVREVVRVRRRRQQARAVRRDQHDEHAAQHDRDEAKRPDPRPPLGADERAHARRQAPAADCRAPDRRVAQGKCARVARHTEGPPERALRRLDRCGRGQRRSDQRKAPRAPGR